MTINKTEQALKSIAIQFSVDRSLNWEDTLSQTMDILNSNSRLQAMIVIGRAIKELHD